VIGIRVGLGMGLGLEV